MEKVFFATGNRGKVEEMQPLFSDRGFRLEQVEVDIDEVDALEVEDVVERKARDSYREAGKPVIVEDTGFYVEDLGGFPGAKAAFFDSTVGAEKLLRLVDGSSKAFFRTALAFCKGGKVEIFTGEIRGRLPEEPRGEPHTHLPYNSLFIPEQGPGETYAENPGLIEKYSHRKKATEKFLEWMEKKESP